MFEAIRMRSSPRRAAPSSSSYRLSMQSLCRTAFVVKIGPFKARRRVPALLAIEDLHVSFGTDRGRTGILHGVSLDLEPGQTIGVVGESGSGKTVLVRAVLGLLDAPFAIDGGGSSIGARTFSRWRTGARAHPGAGDRPHHPGAPQAP